MKINLIILLVIALAYKPTNGEEKNLLESEIHNSELISLANQSNLKENLILNEITNTENQLNNVEKLRKEQAKLMSMKRKVSESDSEVEVSKLLSNSLRANRMQMIENQDKIGMPKMLSFYLNRKNQNELRKLSQENLLPKNMRNLVHNIRVAEVPSFLASSKSQRRLHNKINSDSNEQENLHTLSASRNDNYFQSNEYLTNRVNNALRKNRMNMIRNGEADGAPVMLANYLKKKAESEHGKLLDLGIVPDEYEAEEAPKEEEPRKNISARKNKPKKRPVVQQVEEENQTPELDYELTTKRPPRRKPDVFVIEDKTSRNKNPRRNQLKQKNETEEVEAVNPRKNQGHGRRNQDLRVNKNKPNAVQTEEAQVAPLPANNQRGNGQARRNNENSKEYIQHPKNDKRIRKYRNKQPTTTVESVVEETTLQTVAETTPESTTIEISVQANLETTTSAVQEVTTQETTTSAPTTVESEQTTESSVNLQNRNRQRNNRKRVNQNQDQVVNNQPNRRNNRRNNNLNSQPSY